MESEIKNMTIRPAYKPQSLDNHLEFNSLRKNSDSGKKGRGLSAALGSRLGVRPQQRKSRSRSRSRSPRRHRKTPPRKRRDRR